MHTDSTQAGTTLLLCLSVLFWTAGATGQEAGNPREIAVTLSAPAVYVPNQAMELTVRITAGVAVEPEGENAVDPVLATRCIRTAMIRFHHPLLMAQCERMPGPSPEEAIAFLLSALEPPPAA